MTGILCGIYGYCNTVLFVTADTFYGLYKALISAILVATVTVTIIIYNFYGLSSILFYEIFLVVTTVIVATVQHSGNNIQKTIQVTQTIILIMTFLLSSFWTPVAAVLVITGFLGSIYGYGTTVLSVTFYGFIYITIWSYLYKIFWCIIIRSNIWILLYTRYIILWNIISSSNSGSIYFFKLC